MLDKNAFDYILISNLSVDSDAESSWPFSTHIGEFIMATLKTTRHTSAYTARSRLNQVIHEHAVPPRPAPEPVHLEPIGEPAAPVQRYTPDTDPTRPSGPARTSISNGSSIGYRQSLSEVDQHNLLLQTVKVYDGWHLASIQHRQENGGIVAYLVRNSDQSDPSVAIRDGRALQIIMDAVGDMQIHHARRRRGSFWRRLFGNFGTSFSQQF